MSLIYLHKTPTPSDDERVKVIKSFELDTWPPKNMKLATEHEFWHWSMSWGFEAEVYHGNIEIEPGVWATVRHYIVDHSQMISGGFTVAHIYSTGNWKDKPTVRYYKWMMCEHKFTVQNLGRCYNRYTCTVCNRSYEVDSSD